MGKENIAESLEDFLMKEVDTIQGIINRMSSNSFLVKGWTLTLVVGSMILANATSHQVVVAFIPLVMFWFLDAYFLRQERMYRKLYEWVISNRLKTNEHLFDLNAYRFEDKVQSKLRTMLSSTLIWFYGSIVLLVVIYSGYLMVEQGGLKWPW